MVVGKPKVQLMPKETARPKGKFITLAQMKPRSTVPATPQAAESNRAGRTDSTCCGVVVARLEKIRMVTKKVIRPPDWVLDMMPFSRKPRAKNTAPITRQRTK